MEFPLLLEAGDEFTVTLHDNETLRFKANYRHVFPSESALMEHAWRTWDSHYVGLTLIEGKTIKELDEEKHRAAILRANLPRRLFTAKIDIEFLARDLTEAYVRLGDYFDDLVNELEPVLDHTGTIDIKPKD